MSSQVLWFRRDLRLEDHPALLRAAAPGPGLPLFVLDPDGYAEGSPARIVDHGVERAEAPARYAQRH